VKFFLLLFLIVILLYLSFLFIDKPSTIELSPSFSEPAVIIIEPMVTPPIIELSEHEETLLKLKIAVDDAVSKDNSFKEYEANSILAILKESVPIIVLPPVIIKKEPIKVVLLKKKIQRVKVKKVIPNIVAKRSSEPLSSQQIKKREVTLGEQDDLHYLSKEERKNFKNFEVVSVSKTFVLEEEQKIKSPEHYNGVEKEVKFEDLAFVETLGIVNVSTPSIYQNELIKR
jgi:hypothetical protein